MTPPDLLARLETEGVNISLKLRLEGENKPSTESLELVEHHRDALITYLATAKGDTPQMCRLSEELVNGSVLCKRCWRYHLRACAPSNKLFESRG